MTGLRGKVQCYEMQKKWEEFSDFTGQATKSSRLKPTSGRIVERALAAFKNREQRDLRIHDQSTQLHTVGPGF